MVGGYEKTHTPRRKGGGLVIGMFSQRLVDKTPPWMPFLAMIAWFKSLFRKPKMEDLARHRAVDEQRKRARILVIDDDPHAFPVELLKKEGYNLTYWSSVENYKDLETGEYDIIVLDIQGIIPHTQKGNDDGIALLKHIKTYNPAQLVIAYSGKKYDLNKAEFWTVADDYLGKPSSLMVCKQKIDDLLETRFSIEHYWSVLRKLLVAQEIPEKDIARLETKLARSLQKDSSISKQDIAETIQLSKETLSTVVVVAGLIARIFKSGTAP